MPQTVKRRQKGEGSSRVVLSLSPSCAAALKEFCARRGLSVSLWAERAISKIIEPKAEK